MVTTALLVVFVEAMEPPPDERMRLPPPLARQGHRSWAAVGTAAMPSELERLSPINPRSCAFERIIKAPRSPETSPRSRSAQEQKHIGPRQHADTSDFARRLAEVGEHRFMGVAGDLA